ncbi:hypothetical protein GCM10022255_020200 [Dactylosporangium darangshiense]|uniref:Coenzyme F420 biosynthesis-associated protein n=1 Tax=Dactylosporangium darangshiense TaxID=579108 RepID=A0ABP8D475_9ACTN
MAQFVDWDLAAATAAALGKSGPAVSYEEAADAVTDLRELAEEAAGHVTDFTGLRAMIQGPPVRVVDRRDWAATNIEGLREVIQPLAERLAGGKAPGAIVGAIGSRLTGVQAGTVLAYLSGKVLGQYEVFSADPGQLLLVAPNIVEAERKLGADSRDFRLWVCLHEVTHRVQFTGVPWMRGYFLGEVGAFVDASQLNQDQLAERVRRGISALADVVRDPDSRVSVLDLVQTPGQKAVLDRLTALMTVLEGHAEFVMDGVGPDVIPSVEEIRSKFNRRREAGNPLDRVLRKLLGVDVKLRQYAEGRKFVHAVVERVGMASFNKIWQSPLTIPRLDELGDPEAWIVRVLGESALHRPAPTPPLPITAQAAVTEAPPAPVPAVPESVDESPAEAGVAEPTEVAGLAAEELETAAVAEPELEPEAVAVAEPEADAEPAEVEPGPPPTPVDAFDPAEAAGPVPAEPDAGEASDEEPVSEAAAVEDPVVEDATAEEHAADEPAAEESAAAETASAEVSGAEGDEDERGAVGGPAASASSG